ncbi:sulfatase-like hydrolase/transferase [Flavobacterium jejuense]|uniref:Sulfatase-like hydrolase/transferase n=1 Tax=Flavobacterium jejuense TaxID=1544455 RepID=A0ABX0ISU3_9FLAO|nr:LTA synthase family protein [Flavobacterium jejuense]NHN25879.1 sulfatase-like hydrolase/transferase [Flavobacterium jejuense]
MNKYLTPFKNLAIFYIIISFILRLVLVFHPITQSSFSTLEILKIFILSIASDFCIFIVASIFLWLYLLFLSNSKFNKPWGYFLFGSYVLILIYILSGKSILNEYGGVLPELGIIFVGFKTILIGLLLFLPRYRKQIRLTIFSFTIFLFVLVIIQNAVSEFFFWNEFGVKYNFIAVDYLVYTNTVIGNIMESYPVIPLFTSVIIITLLVTYYIVKKSKVYLEQLPSLFNKLKITAIYIVFFIISLFAIPNLAKLENSKNVFTNELQSNGIYKFYLAFMNSELDFYKFYNTIDDTKAFAELKKQLPNISGDSTLRTITNDSVELKKNVVLITIESLSAEYLKLYGNKENLTPFLDSLALQSMNFSNLYATGNRTVRGLEAVTLCIPPTPGESVVKRKDNNDKFSTGSIFKLKGYQVKYLYGGDAYFDNMENFFSGNGYDIIDKNAFTTDEISFSNIWGVCDEDMAKKAIKTMNEEAKTGKPFFNHWMTVSNHRPFTYPDGKINIPGDAKSREGGVKYTDYALKQFFKMAKKQPWYKNTVFVILSDHCASSSGKMELPVDKYHIPAMIYAPGFIEPRNESKLMSQIDLMPTLFGLLHFNYESKFYGQDVMKPEYKPRAFIATYEDLGFIKNNILTIISPVKKEKQFDLKKIENLNIKDDFQIYYEEIPRKELDKSLILETTAYYQTTTYMLKNKKYQKL